jgi:hypothetical protein
VLVSDRIPGASTVSVFVSSDTWRTYTYREISVGMSKVALLDENIMSKLPYGNSRIYARASNSIGESRVSYRRFSRALILSTHNRYSQIVDRVSW